MANPLIKSEELAIWTQNDETDILTDPFAEEVMNKVSDLAKFLGGTPTWTYDTAPFDVRMVVLQVCKRTYENPGQIVSESVGPISERRLDVAAMLTNLTESERKILTKYNPDGDPDGGGELWILNLSGPEQTTLQAVMYVPDDSLSDWYIPMFSPGDPGDPNNYPGP